MHVRPRPRMGFVYPILAVTAAAAFLLLVALSIALQPPKTDGARPIDGALAWMRAVFFSAGALAFLVGIASFARTSRSDDDTTAEMEEVQGFVASAEPEPEPDETDEPEPVILFTLIATTRDDAEMCAIADFPDARSLLIAIRDWRSDYPDEHLRVFERGGIEVDHHPPEPEPAEAPRLVRVKAGSRTRRGLVAGGVR